MASNKISADLHEDLSRDEAVAGSSNRSFGIVFTVVFAIIGLLPALQEPRSIRVWSLALAGGTLLVALVFPKLLAPFNRIWTKFGLLLHKIVSPIVLGLLFFVVITPIGLLLRIAGKDVLGLRRDPKASSYWIERAPPGPAPETMKNQF